MIGQHLFSGVAAVVFTLYVVLAAPGVTWFDGGEFVAGISGMGVTHPPGQPAYMVLGKIASLLPVGSVAFRLSLLSAFCAACAAGCLAVLVSRAAAKLDGLTSGHVPLPGAIAGLLFGVSPALALQGVRPELYALAVLLGLLGALAVQSGGRRGLALAVVPRGIAGAVHHALWAAAVPGFVLLPLGGGKGSLRAALIATASLLPFGLLQFLWLPLRSMARPELDFGVARTFERVLMAATGMGYARSYRLEEGQLARNLLEHARVMLLDLGWFALVAAAAATLLLLWRVKPRPLLVAVVFLVAGVLPTALQGVFFPENPDAHGYLLGPVAVCAAGAGLGCWMVLRALPVAGGASALIGGATLLAVSAAPLAQTVSVADQRHLDSPRRLAAELLHSATPGALVLLGGDSWILPALAARQQERRRPDVLVVGMHMLDALALPDLAARNPAVPTQFTPEEQAAIGGAGTGLQHEPTLRAIVAHRPPVDVFVNDFFVAPDLLARREPHGLLLRLHRAAPGPPPPPPESFERLLEDEVLQGLSAGPGWAADRVGRETLSRRDLARAGLVLQRGDRELALRLLRRGSDVAPNPWDFIHLARHRLESGADVPGPWTTDTRAEQAAAALVDGDLEAARAGVDAVLAVQPTHPVALLTAERLFTLGHHVSTRTESP